jgi:uncharacterized membrane protein
MFDEFALINFLTCISIYFSLLLYSFKSSKPTKQTVFKLIYKEWVNNRLKDDDPIVAVQTLRNFMMGNSTFISALFILLGILVGFYTTGIFEDTLFWGSPYITVSLVKMGVNIFMIIFCLINFILSIRYITRLSLLISGKPQNYQLGKFNGKTLTQKTFISAQNHWMFGVRGLFYLFATLLWYINSIFFIIATYVVTIYLIAFHNLWMINK